MIGQRYEGIVNNIGDYTYHILGCGAIGSSAAMQLARMGAKELVLYDFDKVGPENVGVSQYVSNDVCKYKVDALKSHIKSVHNDITVLTLAERFEEFHPSEQEDIIILGFDSMKARLEAITAIVKKGKPYALIDGRMGAEHYQQYSFRLPSLKAYLLTWYNDSDGDPEPCNAKATSYCSNMSGSFIVNTVRKMITNQPFDGEFAFNFPTMMLEIKK